MAKAVQGLPEFLAMKRKLTIHTAIQGEIFKQLELRDLREVGKLEQGLVFGELKSRDLINAMQVRDQCFCYYFVTSYQCFCYVSVCIS